MRLSMALFIPLLLVALATPPLMAQEVTPRCASVEPASGKAGTEFVVTGESLGKSVVDKLYFTDGTNDIELKMAEQTDTTIKSKVPASAKAGIRYKLMVLTKGKEPKMIEQPVRFEIEE